jgi:hypothetical protein
MPPTFDNLTRHSERLWSSASQFRLLLRVWLLLDYYARYLLIVLKKNCHKRASFARNIQCSKIDCVDLALLLRFEYVNDVTQKTVVNVVTGLFLWCGGLRCVLRSIEVCSAGGAFWSIYYNISWRGSGDFVIWIVSFNPVDQAFGFYFW